MSLPLLAIVVLVVLALGYTVYGRLSPGSTRSTTRAVTPAKRVERRRRLRPHAAFYLLGQHFSAIAAAGPIAGPILACQSFGWLPCLLWIVLGVIFIGAVHDFSALVASVRHGARSIAEIVRENLGRAGVARDHGLHLDRARLRDRRVRRHHGGHLRGPSEDAVGAASRSTRAGRSRPPARSTSLLAWSWASSCKRLAPPLWLLTLDLRARRRSACVALGTRDLHLAPPAARRRGSR